MLLDFRNVSDRDRLFIIPRLLATIQSINYFNSEMFS